MVRDRVNEVDPRGSKQIVEPARPAPPTSSRVSEWVEWFGVARLVTSAVAVAVVCAGAWWLVRVPTAPPESTLPFASGSLPTTVTLPAPTSPAPAADRDTGSRPLDAVVVVHVAGAVEQPGVYELTERSRVADAIDAAGGLLDVSDPDRINLAAVLTDGARVLVPVEGEEVVWPVDSLDTGGGAPAPTGPLDLNVADAVALDALPGVGPATAAAIVTDRDRNGPFVSVADLERVPGIGPAKLAALDGLVTT